MGADYVEEYKWRFKMPIPKATMLAMDKLVAEGKWLKLKNGAYFVPIRDYRGISPQGVYIYPKQRIARCAYDGGTNGFFGSPDEYEFMLK